MRISDWSSDVCSSDLRSDIEHLLASIRRLPADTKTWRLRQEVDRLRDEGYPQVMVFSQFTDTMDALRRELARDDDLRIMCFSGRGGEVQAKDGRWREVSREEVKRRFRADRKSTSLNSSH